MTRTIDQLYKAVDALKIANLNLSNIIIGHLDDGQRDMVADAIEGISTAMQDLSQIENELRFGKTWTAPA